MTERRQIVIGDAKRWKALSHPLRQEVLRHLGEHGPATSTTLAQALGESTGSTSYHLRVLAEAGVIEEVRERAHGRERWWRTFPADHREPDYNSLSAEDRAELDEWRAGQIPGEIELFNRFLREFRQHGQWARAARGSGYFTAEDLQAFCADYLALLSKYARTAAQAPPGAQALQLRMFCLPDEPAPPQPSPRPASPASPEQSGQKPNR